MIKKLMKSDLSQMLKIWNQHHKILTTPRTRHTKKSLTEWYQNPGKEKYGFFGLFETNKLQAFMVVKYKNDKTLWIKQLACDKKEYRKGHGTALVKYAIKQAKKMPIFSEVMVHNFEALNFFFKQNFTIVKYNERLQEFTLRYVPNSKL
ncbi:MAG: GNAT family N-acetyltransferase [Candidatus Aenigmarchaeota archaeon]|nr:GNAT family N-acetyltransferase [Candidatus Aenigmarchaeota archaeon]